MIKKLILLFKYGKELEEVLREKQEEKLRLERESKKDNLKLCFKHKQESKRSHYSEDNCDYCKLLKRIKELENK